MSIIKNIYWYAWRNKFHVSSYLIQLSFETFSFKIINCSVIEVILVVCSTLYVCIYVYILLRYEQDVPERMIELEIILCAKISRKRSIKFFCFALRFRENRVCIGSRRHFVDNRTKRVRSKVSWVHMYSTSFQTWFPRKRDLKLRTLLYFFNLFLHAE